MTLGLVLYAYASGTPVWRVSARARAVGGAFQVIGPQQRPAHATFASHRAATRSSRAHDAALDRLAVECHATPVAVVAAALRLLAIVGHEHSGLANLWLSERLRVSLC